MDGRLFGLDAQLLFDAITMFIYIMVLFVILSRLFFKPVRQFMEKRQEGIDQNKTEADEYMNRAEKLKAEYEEKLKQVHKEAESLMSASRRQAHRRQEDVIEAAKEKASAIMTQAQQEACQEKNRVKDEVKPGNGRDRGTFGRAVCGIVRSFQGGDACGRNIERNGW